VIASEQIIELLAGQHPGGERVIEQVLVSAQPQVNAYQLLKSPVFARGVARADIIQLLQKPRGAFKIIQHSGNLCIRVFSKQGFSHPSLNGLQHALTVGIEKLGGDLDVQQDRVLVYSIHVSCGFNEIEKLLTETLADQAEVAWYYGNVYHPETGQPLNWWQTILSSQ
jgi:hypothetical protein